MGKLIFLDIDGVLRRVTSNPSCFDQDCLDNFESAVRQCDKSKIVISSTWRLAMPLKELRYRFSPDMAARIVGITPENFEDEVYERHAEIKAFLEEKKVTALPWLAITMTRHTSREAVLCYSQTPIRDSMPNAPFGSSKCCATAELHSKLTHPPWRSQIGNTYRW